MNTIEHRVTVIVDLEFVIRLRDLLAEEAIWIVNSSTNAPVIQTIWKEHSTTTRAELTSFKFDPKGTPEDWLVSELATIELHHGEYSHDPAWSILNAVGVSWSDRIARELAELGFSEHVNTALGFEARRK
jgi:hypothetical protein